MSVATLREHERVWVAPEDFAPLLKLGLRMIPAKEVLLKGMSGKLGGPKNTEVIADAKMKPGTVRFEDGTVVEMKF